MAAFCIGFFWAVEDMAKKKGPFSKSIHPKKRAFLAAYAEVGNITRAAEIAGIERNMHYRWMAEDPEYPELFRRQTSTRSGLQLNIFKVLCSCSNGIPWEN